MRVLDVFKAWDRSGDGILSEDEFLQHVQAFFTGNGAAGVAGSGTDSGVKSGPDQEAGGASVVSIAKLWQREVSPRAPNAYPMHTLFQLYTLFQFTRPYDLRGLGTRSVSAQQRAC